MNNVKLNISSTPKNGRNWYSSPTPSGKNYWYRFSGGNGKNGHQEFRVGTEHKFAIEFKRPDDKYVFAQFYKFDDPDNQLSATINGDNTVTVTDQCSQAGTMIYGVYVHPEGDPGELFLCHPRIVNRH